MLRVRFVETMNEKCTQLNTVEQGRAGITGYRALGVVPPVNWQLNVSECSRFSLASNDSLQRPQGCYSRQMGRFGAVRIVSSVTGRLQRL